jgi:Flp pilus assembly protein TadD
MIPFITEEVWQLLGRVASERGLPEPAAASPSVMVAAWPVADVSRQDAEIETRFARFQAVLGALREIRSRQNIPPKSPLEFSVRCDDQTSSCCSRWRPISPRWPTPRPSPGGWTCNRRPPTPPSACRASRSSSICSTSSTSTPRSSATRSCCEKLIGQIQAKEKKLANANFVERAPADVVQRERESLQQLQQLQQRITVEATLTNLQQSALYNLGNELCLQGQRTAAIGCYRKALQVRPADTCVMNNLGNALLAQQQPEEAAQCYQQALAIEPGFAEVHRNLAMAYAEQDKLDAARRSLEAAHRLRPDKTLWAMRAMTFCPTVFQSQAELDAYRRELDARLDALLATPLVLQSPDELEADAFAPPFNLAHHGRDNRPLVEKLAALFRPHVPKRYPRLSTGLPRVGFLVTSPHEGGFLRAMGGVVKHLDRKRFKPLVLCPQSAASACRLRLGSDDIEIVPLRGRFTEVAEQIWAARCDEATVTITVVNVNDAPLAEPDEYVYAIDANGSLTIPAPGVLANDWDIDGPQPLEARQFSQPTDGDLSPSADGSFIYTPPQGFVGTATFTYRAYDGEECSEPATVTIRITHAPAAQDDSYAVDEDTLLAVAAPGVLANDSDPDTGDTLEAVLVDGPGNGSLNLFADGSFLYQPDLDFWGTDFFTYRATDRWAFSNVATVTITVRAVNDAPVARDDAYSMAEDDQLVVGVPGVLDNDTDADFDLLTAPWYTLPSEGTLQWSPLNDGSFTYTPRADYFGIDSFTYKAFDGLLYSEPATVTITIDPVNDPPVAVADEYEIGEDDVLVVDAAGGVLANDGDVDNTVLYASLVQPAVNGAIQLNANGSFTYVPHLNYYGQDTFTYQAYDGIAYSAVQTVTITVHPVIPSASCSKRNVQVTAGPPIVAW